MAGPKIEINFENAKLPEEHAEFLEGTGETEVAVAEDKQSTEPTSLSLQDQLRETQRQLNELKALMQTGDSNKVSGMDMAKLISEAVSATTIALHKANKDYDQSKTEAVVREQLKKRKRCEVCNLPVNACGGAYEVDANGKPKELNPEGQPVINPKLNHIKVYVGPKDEDYFQWFQGFIISGVRFLSDYPGHMIWIPKKSDILTNVNLWERNEKELSRRRQGAGKGMKAPHGSVQNVGFQGAIGWR